MEADTQHAAVVVLKEVTKSKVDLAADKLDKLLTCKPKYDIPR
jgi:hypothetical protein